jgi:hypothetical protein
MNILLVEDMTAFGQPIKEQLERAGHQVTWIIGATCAIAEKVIGILPSPDAAPLVDSWNGDPSRLVALDLAGLDCALVDGGLIGPVNSGTRIIPALVQNKIVCVAISGGGAGNPGLIEAGASLGLPKEHVLLALRAGVLNPVDVVSKTQVVARRMPNYVEMLHGLAEQARAAGRRFDYGFVIE